MAMTELCKHVRQIRRHTTLHMRRAIHAVLVLAKIIPFAPMRVRKHCVGLGNQLELFFIAALRATKKKNKSHPSLQIHTTEAGDAPCLGDV